VSTTDSVATRGETHAGVIVIAPQERSGLRPSVARAVRSPYDFGMRSTVVVIVLALAVAAGVAVGGRAAEASPEAKRVPAGASAGCRATPIAPGEDQVNTTSQGLPRYYLRHVPPAYNGKQPFPLVIDLHGYLEGAKLHTVNTMLGQYGDAYGFITITPQGSGSPAAHWDVGFNTPDVRFMGDLLDEAERTLCLNERRIYVTGYSNGAFLASSLACVYADRIAAIAPVAGLRDPAGCKPTRPVPIVAFHGTADQWVSFNGGLGPSAQAASADDGTGRTLAETSAGQAVARGGPIPGIVAAWAKRNHCAAKPAQTRIASDVVLERYRCSPQGDVQFYRVDGGGHTWPGSKFSMAIEADLGPTTSSIDADQIIWSFFKVHPLPGG
jgi:polyhydroxybutyrate depolymerase